MKNKSKIYFASDVHLGAPSITDHIEHERRFVNWLSSIQSSAKALYLLGDIFDFWYEYKYVVPSGYIRVLGKLAEFVDQGIQVHFFTGNHDLWTFGYLEKEVGMHIHHNPKVVCIDGKYFFLAHGDGLGDPSRGFKLIKSIFQNRIAQKLFSLIHPNIAFKFGLWWSGKSRKISTKEDYSLYQGEDKEHLILFSKDYLKDNFVDYLIFGHRHIPLDLELAGENRVIILGDWINEFTYGVWDGEQFSLKTYEDLT